MNNEYLLPSNEYNEFESRAYVEPSLQPAQTETFIDKLRETQGAHGQEITAQTEALGTTTPSNLGGLTGAGSYFSSRYQTPRTNALAQNLRTTAQATALNEALANEQAIWKKRYNEAYRDYQSREHNKANTPTTDTVTEGGVEYEDTSEESKKVASVEPSYSPMGSGTFKYTPNEALGLSSVMDSLKTTSIMPGSSELFNTSWAMPSSTVDINRDKFGNITSLTYDGKTYDGDDAKKMYQKLQTLGTVGGRI